MKNVLLLVLIGFSTSIFAQTRFVNSLDYKVVELKKYILKDFKNIKSYYPSIDWFEIGLEIDTDTKLLEAIELNGFSDTVRIDSLKIYPPLQEKLKTIFRFNPSTDDKFSLFTYSMFRIELKEDVLKSEIKKEEAFYKTRCKYMVKPNGQMQVTINEFSCKPSMTEAHIDSLPKSKIKATLRGLKSEVFQLHENYYVYFVVDQSAMDDHCTCNTYAYIYYVKDDVADLVSKIRVEGAHQPILKLKEKSKWENENNPSEFGFFRVDMDVKFK